MQDCGEPVRLWTNTNATSRGFPRQAMNARRESYVSGAPRRNPEGMRDLAVLGIISDKVRGQGRGKKSRRVLYSTVGSCLLEACHQYPACFLGYVQAR